MKTRRIRLVICALIILALITWVKFLSTPLITDEHGYEYTIQPGNTIRTVIADLYYKNIIKNRMMFDILVALHKGGHDIKAGEYLFPKGTTPSKLLHQILTGSGLVYHQFTIVPGWNMRQLRAAIE